MNLQVRNRRQNIQNNTDEDDIEMNFSDNQKEVNKRSSRKRPRGIEMDDSTDLNSDSKWVPPPSSKLQKLNTEKFYLLLYQLNKED